MAADLENPVVASPIPDVPEKPVTTGHTSPDSESSEESLVDKTSSKLTTVLYILRTRPHVTVYSLICLTVLLVPTMVGLYLAMGAEVESRKSKAIDGASLETSNGITQKLDGIFMGVKAMVSYTRVHPNCSELNVSFNKMSLDVRTFDVRNTLIQLEADIAGIITLVEPPLPNDLHWLYGFDILTEGNFLRTRSLIRSPGLFSFDGPAYQPDGFSGGYAIYAIFLPAESPDQDMGCGLEPNSSYSDITWDPVRKMKFWGFVQGLVNLQELYDGSDPILDPIKEQYLFKLYISPNLPENDYNYLRAGNTIHETHPPPKEPVVRDIYLENMHWVLELSPRGGWVPNWYAGCIAAGILGSVVISLMLMWMLVVMELQKWSNRKLATSIARLAETTDTLKDEKLATDELVKRQLKLIACLEGIGDGGKQLFSSNVLDRINDVKRQMKVQHPPGANASNASTEFLDEITMTELLGEGSFGKVYRGLWRNSVVAVKSIILPANMSGAAKREKMAVMEAAISSSLSHPNIVQTYTYDIMRHQDSALMVINQDMASASMALVAKSRLGPGGSNLVSKEPKANAGSTGTVHSLEVRIVLEYCDKGSLRSALDACVFKDPTGKLNYKQIVETVADVARAMLHLHRANVLHGDLKSVNVLLKSNGSQGRGFVAKVADFGLSVTIDTGATHMSNVFQGTLTHMSPELLLKGQVSRQTDVYAFGITMWEIMTAGMPFEGTPVVTLGHGIAKKRWRPKWPINTPLKYRLLAEACWAQKVEDRPGFDGIMKELSALRQGIDESTMLLLLDGTPVVGSKEKLPVLAGGGDISLDIGALICSSIAMSRVPEEEEDEEDRLFESRCGRAPDKVSSYETEEDGGSKEDAMPGVAIGLSPAAVMAGLRPSFVATNKKSASSRQKSSTSMDIHYVMRSLGSGRLEDLHEVDEDLEGEEEEEN